MNNVIEKEIKGLLALQAKDFSRYGYYSGYISVHRIKRDGKLLTSVYIDRYQMTRDFYKIPDSPHSAVTPHWDVDEWEECREYVFQGNVESAKDFRRIIVMAKRAEYVHREFLRNNRGATLALMRGLAGFKGKNHG
ncbi:MAG: hypothetical protein [Bacteriophage sp.]|nr:MAG: hypothetical protein [Bacteriophage sp.]